MFVDLPAIFLRFENKHAEANKYAILNGNEKGI